MNGDAKLVQALSFAIGHRFEWADIVVVRNVGGVRQGSPIPDALETRGFHALLLSGNAKGTHYVKVRSPGDANAQREVDTLALLGTHQAAAQLIPKSQVVSLPEMTAQILTFIDGPTFLRRVNQGTLARTVAEAKACFMGRTLLLETAVSIGALVPPPMTIEPVRLLEPWLRVLEDGWVPSDITTAVRAAMPETMPAAPQHGDLTPANIVWGKHGPVFLDFEYFGLINCPLYDAWHFIRSICRVRGEADTWMRALMPRTTGDAAWRQLLDEEATRLQLTERQLRASMLWYLTQFSGRFIARGNPESYYRPYLDDLSKAAVLVCR